MGTAIPKDMPFYPDDDDDTPHFRRIGMIHDNARFLFRGSGSSRKVRRG